MTTRELLEKLSENLQSLFFKQIRKLVGLDIPTNERYITISAGAEFGLKLGLGLTYNYMFNFAWENFGSANSWSLQNPLTASEYAFSTSMAASLGLGIAVEGTAGALFGLSFNTRAGDEAGFGLALDIGVALGEGVKFTLNWAYRNKRLEFSGIGATAVVGVAASIGVSATYSITLFNVAASREDIKSGISSAASSIGRGMVNMMYNQGGSGQGLFGSLESIGLLDISEDAKEEKVLDDIAEIDAPTDTAPIQYFQCYPNCMQQIGQAWIIRPLSQMGGGGQVQPMQYGQQQPVQYGQVQPMQPYPMASGGLRRAEAEVKASPVSKDNILKLINPTVLEYFLGALFMFGLVLYSARNAESKDEYLLFGNHYDEL